MALSEQEQRLLEEMERGLYETDASLANRLANPGAPTPRRIIAGAALAIVGLSILVSAVSLQVSALGVLGFLIMLGGLIAASSTAKTNPKAAAKPKTQGAPTKTTAKSFFEQRWDKRQGQ